MRIRWRVLGSFLIVAVLVVAALALIAGFGLRGAFLDNLEADLTREARELAVTINGAGTGLQTPLVKDGVLQTFAREIGTAGSIRLTVVAKDGLVLADSEEDPGTMENHRNRPEVVTALAGGEGRSRRLSATLRQEMLYVAVPAGPGDLPWSGGVVRVAVPAARVDPLLAHVVRLPLLVALVLLLPILILTYMLSRSVTRPIERLRTMAVAVAGGDLSYRVGTGRHDELGELGDALNQMASELQQRVEHLGAEQEQSTQILAAMGDGVLVLDASGTVVRANESASRILGARQEELEGRSLLHGARSFPALALVERARQAGCSVTGQVELSGTRILWVQAVPLLAAERGPRDALVGDNAGRRAPVLLVFRDETARRRAEAVRRDFVANVSHELKTPLAGLSLLATTLRQAVREDPEQAEHFAERLGIEVGRLNDLVADLLVLSRLEEPGRPASEMGVVDLATIARQVVLEAEPQAEALSRTVHVDAKDPTEVRGDAVELATMVRNLVDNAIRYNRPEGQVWVTVEHIDDSVRLVVKDDGAGIPLDQQSRIFERFYRVDKARSRETGGTGLGLSIVKHVVEIHGGGVEVESRVGVGSTFTVTLPAGKGNTP